MLRALGKSKNLESIDVSGNGLGDDGTAALAGALHCAKSLKRVVWDENNISVHGLRMVLAALPLTQNPIDIALPLADIALMSDKKQAHEVSFQLVNGMVLRVKSSDNKNKPSSAPDPVLPNVKPQIRPRKQRTGVRSH